MSMPTNKKPVLSNLQYWFLIGQSGQILASDWLSWAINISQGQLIHAVAQFISVKQGYMFEHYGQGIKKVSH
jgi:hypothetical protein